MTELEELRTRLKEVEEELETWRSVFPDIAPQNVLPDRSLLEARLKEVERERDEGVERPPMADHKWFDPECGAAGCQSLVWKSRYESAVQGRRDFRQAFREEREKAAEAAAQLADRGELKMDLEKRLQVAYDKVAEWPENRMKLEAVIELGPGFTDLLELRNLIPEVIKALPKFNVVKGDIIMTVPKSLFDELNKWVGELSHFPSEPATELRLYGRVIIRPE